MDKEQLFQLSVPEKLKLLEDLWDSIASVPENTPLHEWQKEELARRRENYLRTPEMASSWEEVRARLRQPHE